MLSEEMRALTDQHHTGIGFSNQPVELFARVFGLVLKMSLIAIRRKRNGAADRQLLRQFLSRWCLI